MFCALKRVDRLIRHISAELTDYQPKYKRLLLALLYEMLTLLDREYIKQNGVAIQGGKAVDRSLGNFARLVSMLEPTAAQPTMLTSYV